MKDRLFSHPYAKMLLTNGEAEVGLAGTLQTQSGPITVKLKPDYIKAGKHIIVDLKTAADASIDGFTRAAADNDYHIQAAFYSDLLEMMEKNGGNLMNLRNFGEKSMTELKEKLRARGLLPQEEEGSEDGLSSEMAGEDEE